MLSINIEKKNQKAKKIIKIWKFYFKDIFIVIVKLNLHHLVYLVGIVNQTITKIFTFVVHVNI